MLRISVTGLSAFVLLGCATSYSGPVAHEISRFSGTKPAIGVLTTASVGQVVIEEFNYTAMKQTDHYRVEKAVKISVGPSMSVNITPATILYKANAQKYCVENYGNDCLYDTDGDGMFDQASSKPGLIEFKKALPEPIKYGPATGDTVVMDAGGYKRQLIYQGRDGNTLRVRYMEFTDNLARPAFTQDLTYPIGHDAKSEIVFRNVKIGVSKVSDTSIDYTVLHGGF